MNNPQYTHSCPRCHQGIAGDRMKSATVVCNSCGFVVSNSEASSQQATHRRFMYAICGIGVILFTVLWQVNVWDRFAIEASGLQMRELIGVTSASDRERMAEICMERKQFACVEREYSILARQDMTKMLRLGRFQLGQRKYDDSARTFTAFFQKGGSDAEAAFLFARVLAHEGRKTEAQKYFKFVLNSKPDAILRSAATEGYAEAMASRNLAGQITR